jgi:hypothetical protein
MIYSLILLFLLFLSIPFAIAQIMPNKKWLIAYAIFFWTLAILLYYNHLHNVNQSARRWFLLCIWNSFCLFV